MLLWLVLACTGDEPDVPVVDHPVLLGGFSQRALILGRLDRAPYDRIGERVDELAAREFEDDGDWETGPNGRNAEAAMANALLAWLHQDQAAADKAADFLGRQETNLWVTDDWDANIRMPSTTINAALALDLLAASGLVGDGVLSEGRDRLLDLTEAIYERYLLDEFFRMSALYYSQNNHPIRTATSMVVPGLLYPDDPRAADWLDWGLGELDYLLSANGQYLQPDGGVSEGPAYYSFAHGAMLATLIAAHNTLGTDDRFTRTCITRNDSDPWTDHGCVEGEPFAFDNPLDSERLLAAADWWVGLQLPWGDRPPYEDGRLGSLNGGALLTSFGGGGHLTWSWQESRDRAFDLGSSLDTTAWHLAYLDDSVAPVEPPGKNRFQPDAGVAVFRSGWDHDAIWGLLIAEHGSVRKTLHDHVDSLSFTLAAYGEYLLMDPGYYKPNELDNAYTSGPEAHNLILIDGVGAPAKGLLDDFGDTDAWLEHTWDGDRLAYAEARQAYEDTELVRSVAFVDERWFVIADRLSTDRTDAREHAWRMNGYAGREAGGVFALAADGAVWERASAGVGLHVGSTAPGFSVVQPPFVEFDAPYVDEIGGDSDGSGHHEVIDGVVQAVAPGFLAIVVPYRTGESPPAVASLGAGDDAVAWRVVDGDTVDLVWLRGPHASTTLALPGGETLNHDGDLLITRLEGPDAFTLGVAGLGQGPVVEGR